MIFEEKFTPSWVESWHCPETPIGLLSNQVQKSEKINPVLLLDRESHRTTNNLFKLQPMPPSDCVKNVKGIFRLIRSFTAEAIERESYNFITWWSPGFCWENLFWKGGKFAINLERVSNAATINSNRKWCSVNHFMLKDSFTGLCWSKQYWEIPN